MEKDLTVINRNRYSTNSEFIIRIYDKSGKCGIKVLDYDKSENNINWLSSVQKFNKVNNKLHPTEKPFNILNGIIKLNTNENDLVFDPFIGSGSCGLVCKETNRNFIGCEIDEKYFTIAKDRIENNDIFEL